MQFPPFVSAVEAPFWTVLARRVLEEWRLCTDPVPVLGYYGPVSGPFDAQCSILSPSRSGLPSIAPESLVLNDAQRDLQRRRTQEARRS